MPTFSNTRPIIPAEKLPLINELPGDLCQMATVITGIVKDDALAVQIAAALSHEFRGTNIYFHNIDSFMRSARNRHIREDFDAGATAPQIARNYHLSARRIWEILGTVD